MPIDKPAPLPKDIVASEQWNRAHHFFLAHTPDDLQQSLIQRETWLTGKDLPKIRRSDADYKLETQVIQARIQELDVLSHTEDKPTIAQKIQERQKKLAMLQKTQPKENEKNLPGGIQREIEALTNASSRLFFLNKFKNEKSKGLFDSADYRKAQLKRTDITPQDRERFTRELKIITEVFMEIIDRKEVDADGEPYASKLLQEKRAQKKAKSKTEAASGEKKKKPSDAKEKVAQKDVPVGIHGVILTPLVLGGVSASTAGEIQKLRTGSTTRQVVSEKSAHQIQADFSTLLLKPRPLVNGAVHPDVLKADTNRRKLLRLVGIAYLEKNDTIWANAQQGKLTRTDRPTWDRALGYLRELVEKKVGSAQDPEITKNYPDHKILQTILRDALTIIPDDPKQDFGLRTIINAGIPTGSTEDARFLDTLYLGLLLRQFDEVPKANQEHKLKELYQRLTA